MLRDVLVYLDICDGNMEEGSFRCDANVSVRRKGEEKLGTRSELKNLNSFRSIERALAYEIERQVDVITHGGEVVQETRLFNVDEGVTYSMRGKEEAHDYRYFPEPDLVPLIVDEAWEEEIRQAAPRAALAKNGAFHERVRPSPLRCGDTDRRQGPRGLLRGDGDALSRGKDGQQLDHERAFEGAEKRQHPAFRLAPAPGAPRGISDTRKGPGHQREDRQGNLYRNLPKRRLAKGLYPGKGPRADHGRGRPQRDDRQRYRPLSEGGRGIQGGKEKLIGFFVGQVMKETKGKANPKLLNELLTDRLKRA